ncbi:MAG TPA: tRNA (adenosine(37)-N6)-threonylcarbamoyltransferase complex ATPase subunit type 1 TsaE [Panacibacter sp.]|nr:tRNA (adenosine(37)-N6)-threonylcarbamoyltransferase complex ATPase subunit type 1 TsaE [Panacibacter sp.]
MIFEYSISEIDKAAQQLWSAAKQQKIWALHGEMGAGKTTLVHALCGMLEVKDVVSSPTYSVINEYCSPVAGIIYHMDWYRLKDEEEAIQAGVEDCLFSGNFCIVEWPEKAIGLLADDVLNIYIETMGENRRWLRAEV